MCRSRDNSCVVDTNNNSQPIRAAEERPPEFTYRVEQKTFECTDCKKKYVNLVSLTRHKNYECQKPPRFSCHICSFKTRYQFTLRAHLFRLHNIVVENSAIQF
ncbi:hypothetical protein HUJ04_008537 [Dendroctonus ponderosae]|nr:hypothetical protein HUJ04_008537 [Dendroctonus ponderosae]KAH1008445.1 hypothetical protein HUJ05_008999 [Dendroctonus ponderosae]